MPLGLMIGSPTPRLGESQSRWEKIVSYSSTSARSCGTPTLNCAVSTAIPGLETEYTWSIPANARDHLLGRSGDQALHVLGRGARERDEHVRHGDVDLRLFLLGRDEHGEQAEQEQHQGQQRGELRPRKKRAMRPEMPMEK